MIRNITTSLAALALLCACSSPKAADADGFVEVENISADSIAINEILNPEQYTLTKDYALIASPKSNKVMYRYSLPEWEFVDTTFSKGDGPGEVNRPIFQQSGNPTTNEIWISDPNKSQIRHLSISDDSVSVLKILSSSDLGGINVGAGALYNDRYMLTSKVDMTGTKREHLFVFDLKDSMRVVDSIASLSVWDVEIEQSGGNVSVRAMVENYGQFKLVGDHIVYSYPLIGTTIIYSISPEGRLTLIKTIGNEYTYEQVAAMEFEKEGTEYTSFEKASDKYLYFLYTNSEKVPDPQNPEKEKAKFLTREIRIYDWDMNPVKKLILDKKETNVVLIDELRGEIYGWNKSLDFEQVYIYKYNI